MKAEDRAHLILQDLEALHGSLESLKDNALRFWNEADQHAMVKAFHHKFGVAIPDAPTLENYRGDLRVRLIEEELEELHEAIDNGDMVEFIDAICDLLYVVHGAALEAGIHQIQPFFEEVHKTNMAKEGGRTRGDGKIQKPEGWKPPDIAGILNERYPDWNGESDGE